MALDVRVGFAQLDVTATPFEVRVGFAQLDALATPFQVNVGFAQLDARATPFQVNVGFAQFDTLNKVQAFPTPNYGGGGGGAGGGRPNSRNRSMVGYYDYENNRFDVPVDLTAGAGQDDEEIMMAILTQLAAEELV